MSPSTIRVWLSGDGYRDPDDNLAMLVGAASARTAAKSGSVIKVSGIVFGDTKDGGQYYMLNPAGTAPAAFGTDDRYGDVAGNRRALGNYDFYKDYTTPAVKGIGTNWKNFDLLATDEGGLRAWNFHGTAKWTITPAARAIATDIIDAVAQGGGNDPNKIIVYSAGGGANVAAEAIGYLLNNGYTKAQLLPHFVVVQHGNNWVTNYEAEARELTRDFTIAISNQNYDTYANGMDGPGLKLAIPAGSGVTGIRFGTAFAEALAVATGEKAYQGLETGAVFRSTRDASDAGSHAFAVDTEQLLDAMSRRLSGTEEMRTDFDWAHLIATDYGSRLREIYSEFDAAAVATLLGGSGASASARTSAALSVMAEDGGGDWGRTSAAADCLDFAQAHPSHPADAGFWEF